VSYNKTCMTTDSQFYHDLLATEAEVTARINELAQAIIQNYRNKDPLFVCLLRGGAPFATRLMFAITAMDPTFHPEMDYMTLRTYGDERTDKQPELLTDLLPTTKAEGRHVILLDDVLDKGVTAHFARARMVEDHGAQVVDLIVLVQKIRERTNFPQATLWGFEAPDVWLTGMGLDDSRIAKEANRWAGYIGIATQ
jgi:hypoxanthine phosphoribosyltransferase